MSEITQANTETRQPQAAPIAPVASDDGRNVNAFSGERAFAVGYRMANALSSSTLVPKEYQGQENIPNVMIAMELANRIGASVFAVMQNIDMIHGRPAWRATFLIATVNACGRFTPLRFRFEGKPGTSGYGCRAVAKDREDGEECIGTLITIGMADAEGWSKKTGSKWKTMPEQMLRYRAAAFWTRVFAPELSLGMHTTDEQEDIGATINTSTMAITQLAATESPLVARLANQTMRESIVRTEPGDPASSTPHDPETGEVLERESTERQPGDDDEELPDEFA